MPVGSQIEIIKNNNTKSKFELSQEYSSYYHSNFFQLRSLDGKTEFAISGKALSSKFTKKDIYENIFSLTSKINLLKKKIE